MTKETTITTMGAMDALRQAFKDDPDYAHSWHCNIAMACYDSFPEVATDCEKYQHEISNEAASRFMKLAFDVDTHG